MIRATTALLPPAIAFTFGDAMFANSSMWPGDPDVVRLDRNLCDPRRELVDELLSMFFEAAPVAAERRPVADVVSFMEARGRARVKVPKTQASLF